MYEWESIIRSFTIGISEGFKNVRNRIHMRYVERKLRHFPPFMCNNIMSKTEKWVHKKST